MMVFDRHLLAATSEVKISVGCNTALIKDGKIFCVSQHIRQRLLMQEQCDNCIRIPGELYTMIRTFGHRSSLVMKSSIYYFYTKIGSNYKIAVS